MYNKTSLLMLLWQTAKDQATMLELAAWRAEQEGDPKGAKDMEEAARMLNEQAEQHLRTLRMIHKGGDEECQAED